MLRPNDVLTHDYELNHKWTITRIIQSYESDTKLAYIHGFDAGIHLLCEKAKLSSPAIADDVRKLANEMFEEAAKKVGYPLQLRRHEGYDHGYYFISTFMQDHLVHHAKILRG